MKKYFIILFAIMMLFIGNNASKATTLKFDNISVPGDYKTMPNNYKRSGLDWTNMNVVNTVNQNKDYPGNVPGEIKLAELENQTNVAASQRVTSPAQVEINTWDKSDFTFTSADFMAAKNLDGGLTIVVQGLKNGSLVDSMTLNNVNTSSITQGTFNWTGINELTFNTSNSSDQNGNDLIFAMDNLKYNLSHPVPTPEPSSLILGCIGLAGLSRLKRKNTLSYK